MIDVRNSVVTALQNVTPTTSLSAAKDGKSDSNILKNSEKFVFQDSICLVGDIILGTKRASVAYNIDEFICSIWLIYKSSAGEAALLNNLTNITNQLTSNELGLGDVVIDSYFTDVVERGDLTVRIKYHKIEYVVKSYTDLGSTKAPSIVTTIPFIGNDGVTSNIILGD